MPGEKLQVIAAGHGEEGAQYDGQCRAKRRQPKQGPDASSVTRMLKQGEQLKGKQGDNESDRRMHNRRMKSAKKNNQVGEHFGTW